MIPRQLLDLPCLLQYGTDAYNPYIMGLGKLNSCTTILTKVGRGLLLASIRFCVTLASSGHQNRNAAFDLAVLRRVAAAEAIFFAGGDQNDYVTEWDDTPLSAVIQTAVTRRGIPVGGTSAGCAILGQFMYTYSLIDSYRRLSFSCVCLLFEVSFTAAQDTIESPDALENPYDPRVTLGPQFEALAPSYLIGVITGLCRV